MEFKTFKNLNNDIINNLYKIPSNIDLVVGVPRSGLLVAELISLYINKPLSSIDVFLEKKIIKSGNTKNKKGFINDFSKLKNVLIVEDSIDTGNSIKEVKEQLKNFSSNINFIYLVAYTRSDKKNMTDIYFEIIDDDRMFEWNYLHNKQLENACFDIDGVLCVDPTVDICQNEKSYLNFITNAPKKLITTRKIGYIVTSRLEKYRKDTEMWLKQNNIEFIELYMFGGTVEERMVPGAHAKYKASVYKKITNSNLFVESDVLQAEMINKETKKGVFCIDNQTYYNGNIIKNNINIKKKRIKYKIKRGLKKLVGDKLYNKIKTLIKGAKNEIK